MGPCIAKSRGFRRHVVAPAKDSLIDLKFKVGAQLSSSDQHCCSFKAKAHGHDTQVMKIDLALISVNLVNVA